MPNKTMFYLHETRILLHAEILREMPLLKNVVFSSVLSRLRLKLLFHVGETPFFVKSEGAPRRPLPEQGPSPKADFA